MRGEYLAACRNELLEDCVKRLLLGWIVREVQRLDALQEVFIYVDVVNKRRFQAERPQQHVPSAAIVRKAVLVLRILPSIAETCDRKELCLAFPYGEVLYVHRDIDRSAAPAGDSHRLDVLPPSDVAFLMHPLAPDFDTLPPSRRLRGESARIPAVSALVVEAELRALLRIADAKVELDAASPPQVGIERNVNRDAVVGIRLGEMSHCGNGDQRKCGNHGQLLIFPPSFQTPPEAETPD